MAGGVLRMEEIEGSGGQGGPFKVEFGVRCRPGGIRVAVDARGEGGRAC